MNNNPQEKNILSDQTDTLTIEHIGKFNVFMLSLCSVLAILGIVVGDDFDKVSGILTLIATVSTGFSFVIPWTIFTIMGIQITTFFFMALGECVHFALLLLNEIYSPVRIFLVMFRVFTFFISAVAGISYLRRLINNSIAYTRLLRNLSAGSVSTEPAYYD
eukprot:gene4546-7930_t